MISYIDVIKVEKEEEVAGGILSEQTRLLRKDELQVN